MAIEQSWEQRVDLVVADPLRGALLVAEVKGRLKPGPIEKSEAWQKLVAYRDEIGAPFALLFTPTRSFLGSPDGSIREFDTQGVFDAYGASDLPSFDRHYVIELVLRTWLMDLTVGYPRAAPPEGFPDLQGDQVLSAA